MRIWLPLAVVALLVGAAWWLLDSEPSTPGQEDVQIVGAVDDESAAEVSLSVLEGTEDAEDALTPAKRVEEVDGSSAEDDASPSSVPKAYREALSGIQGRLIDHDDTPVAGVEITLLELQVSRFLGDFNSAFDEPLRFPRLDIGRDVTDEEGRFRFAGVHAAAWHGLGIDLGGERGTLRVIEQSLHPGEDYDLGEVKLEPFVTFVGEVVDESGQPVAGARVRATNLPAAIFEANVHYLQRDSSLIIAEEPVRNVVRPPAEVMKWVDKLPVPTTHTDSDGKFRLAGAPIGLITTVVDRPGYGSEFRGPTPSGRSGERSVGTITLTAGRIARGRVVDASQQPVEGAQVEVGAVFQVAPGAIGVSARTDADGRFEVRGLPANGGLLVAARAEQSDPWKIEGPVHEDELLVVLEERVPFVVLVQDAGEVPIESAEILLREGSPLAELPIAGLHPFRPPPRKPEAVAPGEYRFERLVPGEYEIVVRAPGFAPNAETITVLPDGTGRDRVILHGGRQVQVRVVDAATDAPVERATVQAYDRRRDNVLDRSRTDEEGLATLGPLSVDLEDETRIWVEHPAYAGTDAVLGPIGEELVVELEAGIVLEGLVHMGGAVPEKSYMLVLADLGEGGGDHPAGEMPRFALTSRTDGTFRVSNLPPGSFNWILLERFLGGDPTTMFRDGFEEPDDITEGTFELVRDGENYLEIDISPAGLTRPGSVQGTILVNGEPGSGWKVEARLDPREEGRDSRQVSTEADAWGNFRIDEVPPGSVYLQVKRENGAAMWNQWHRLMPGEDWQPRVELSLRQVTFQVSDETGALVQGAKVRVSGQNGRSPSQSETDGNGIATVEVVGEAIQVNVTHDDEVLDQQVDLSSYRGEPIALTLAPAVPCSGRIEIAPELTGGSPDRDFIHLWVQSAEGQGVNRSTSVRRDDLTFTLPGMKPGRYTARCFTGTGGVSKSIELHLPPEGDTNLILRFEKGDWGD